MFMAKLQTTISNGLPENKDAFDNHFEQLQSKFKYLSPVTLKIAKMSGFELDPFETGIEDKLQSITSSLLIRTLQLGSCSQAREVLSLFRSDLRKDFVERAVANFESVVKVKYAIYTIFKNDIQGEANRRMVFKEIDLDQRNYGLVEFIETEPILKEAILKKEIKGTFLLPEQMRNECDMYLRKINSYITRYAIAKLRFIATSNNYAIADLVNELKSKAVRSYYRNWLFLSDGHLLSTVKSSVKNTGKNSIKKYTTKSKGRLLQNEDGSYENIQCSLNAGEEFTNSDLNQQIEFNSEQLSSTAEGTHQEMEAAYDLMRAVDRAVIKQPTVAEKVAIQLQFLQPTEKLRSTFISYVSNHPIAQGLQNISNLRTIQEEVCITNSKYQNLICEFCSQEFSDTKFRKKDLMKVNNAVYVELHDKEWDQYTNRYGNSRKSAGI